MIRSYRQRRKHSKDGSHPLSEIDLYLKKSGDLSSDALRQLADELGQPVAGLRGALSYFAHSEPTERVRVCRGTSCELSGAAKLNEKLEVEHKCESVYCLGYCHASPVALFPDGKIVTGTSASPPEPVIRSMTTQPVVTRRIAVGDHCDLVTAREAGVYDALIYVAQDGQESILNTIADSGIRGRGGAGYLVADKWRACAETSNGEKYVVANGDEGDPGSYVDRVLMEQDPHAIIEGLAICGFSVGASKGIIFVRSEYPKAFDILNRAVLQAREAGLLGARLCGSGFNFDIDVLSGLGSYVCGEETALLNAIEGLRGEVRLRPPYPATTGLYGCPTVINNVETLINIPAIILQGANSYKMLGTSECAGTKVMSLNRGFKNPGLVEIEFGTALSSIIEEAGGFLQDTAALILGGPMGSILFPDEWDSPMTYGGTAGGPQLGHGGVVAIAEPFEPERLLNHWLNFMKNESCGKCTPCALGSRQAAELVEKGALINTDQLENIFELMEHASLCAFGQLMPGPMRKLLQVLAHS